jgi:UDP-N-acetylmuramoyl-L-alanyl-D-glutamate--2,6-diaminopimelate ligase
VWTVGGPGTSAKEGVPHWIWTDLSSTGDTTAFTLRGPEGESLRVMVPVIGEHMVANAALAVVMMVSGGVSLAELGLALGEKPVPVFLPGRLERVSGSRGPDVYVDAGRSEDAYLATLRTLRARTAGRVIMVCGTSGNRDASKRPLMGRAAATGADVVIVTDDDPRHEDPSIIRAGLLEGAHSVPGAEVHEIPDPTAAITFAVSLASPGDCVVWCGPGSQAYRDISGTKVPYSARDEARVALAGAGWSDD